MPGSIPSWGDIAAALQAEPARKALIVGHTDSMGDAGYNLVLSGERAEAIRAALLNDVDVWLAHYAGSKKSKAWGAREDAWMLSALPFGSDPYLAGGPDADAGAKVAAVRAFQAANSLEVDGVAGDQTRRALVTAYLAAPGTNTPPDASLEVLGCGKRHPKGGDSAGDRRVDVFLFDGKIAPPPSDCSGGAHPGCKAYGAWVKAVTEPITPRLGAPDDYWDLKGNWPDGSTPIDRLSDKELNIERIPTQLGLRKKARDEITSGWRFLELGRIIGEYVDLKFNPGQHYDCDP